MLERVGKDVLFNMNARIIKGLARLKMATVVK
jgi:hypothetical protein